MKNHIFSIGLLAALAISCSIHEMDFKDAYAVDEFYASIENTDAPDTKVYATEELYLRWNADDRITIFNKYTYNQEYRFTGETGDNSGSFKKVDNGDFVTGNSLDNIYSIYPYKESTRISDTGVISVTLPAEQKYAENTMGLGANTMISATTDNQLLFKNVGGYLMLKLYGENVSVSSITLKGNNGERIAGKATVTMPVNGVPSVVMSETAGQEISLISNTPVKIGSTAETATTFWLVVPPTVFSKGFTLTIRGNKNEEFEKTTTKSFDISRNKLARMSALEVSLNSPEPSDDAIVFADNKLKKMLVAQFDINDDGELSYAEAAAVYDIRSALSDKTFNSFDEFQFFTGMTYIPEYCFRNCKELIRITLPSSIESIGAEAFAGCSSLPSIIIPESVSIINNYAFSGCSNLVSVNIPNSVKRIGVCLFSQCYSLTQITIPDSVNSIGTYAFNECTSLSSINIPNSVSTIDGGAFKNCSNLTSVILPNDITTIGESAFQNCSNLNKIICLNEIPPSLGLYAFNNTNKCPIYVPSSSIGIYQIAQNWSNYADRIQAIPSVPIPEAVDLGLSVKWASFNLGATKPEEYGDYYAWGETEQYYGTLRPLTWKEGKETGYSWSSYKLCMGDQYTMTKYCYNSQYGYNGFTDVKTVLDPEDDSAHVNLGGSWRMPTLAEWTELKENCTSAWTMLNGVNGRKLTSNKNGNSIFLPAAGNRSYTDLNYVGMQGYYWSSSLSPDLPYEAWYMYFYSDSFYKSSRSRCNGFSVRPVYAE